MAKTTTTNGQKVIDYTARDFDSLLRSMREQIPDKLPEWTEYEHEADFGNVLLQLFAHMGDILSYYQDRVANESFLATAQTRRSVIHHLRLIGYRLSTAAPASAELELYLPRDASDLITIRRGDAFATASTEDSPSVRFEYSAEEKLEIDPATLTEEEVETPSGTRRKLVFRSIPVEQGQLVEDEVVGTSDGSANQEFVLARSPLILRGAEGRQATSRDLILRTRLGEAVTEWTLRETLAFSRAGQTDFAVAIDAADRTTIRFGDGTLGAIPESGATIEATYRVGGGPDGNVRAGTITTIADAPQLSLVGALVSNPEPATGGAARETIDHAIQHAPQVFRSLKRAVTGDDYEALARDFGGVGKVRAAASNWNTVTLYVAPEGGGPVSDVLKANLLAYLEDKRSLSTLIEVEDVDYIPIYVTAEVGVVGYYSQDQIVEQARAAAGELLAFDVVDFNRPVYLSKFYEAIEAIEGVAFVNISEFRRAETPGDIAADGKITIKQYELPVAPDDATYAGAIQVISQGGL